MNQSSLVDKIIRAIGRYDAKGKENECRNAIQRAVANAASKNRPLNFIIFTCSTINSEYLWSNTPWLYVDTNPNGNNLEPDLLRIAQVIRELKVVYPLVQLKILIGNTDPYYVYLQQFKDFPKSERGELLQKFNARWEMYRDNFGQWVNDFVPALNPEIISWYRFEKNIEAQRGASFEVEYERVKKNISSYFTMNQLNWELRKLRTQFGAGKYFEKLEKPGDALLNDWVVRKFAEYATQAKWIYENIPNAILIQNEKPSKLRSQMYQPLVREKYKTDFPIAYFLGIDHAGYQ